ncbi:uncharacterized protein LOC113563660 [Ooceraea biroi]|uniref:uncharacterized protein LOC113563660 n=1 Tax=Ooceraea biroi TaxID=2015173 RepID=UPI000F09699A|nr:uncharacterized protein LOC113563660 [Ooceraea biroi]
MNNRIWWNGPSFFAVEEHHWPPSSSSSTLDAHSEQECIISAVSKVTVFIINDLLIKYSNLDKILRIIARCLRFFPEYRRKFNGEFISHQEIAAALIVVYRSIQREAFPEEYAQLSKNKPISNSSNLLSLSPFFDANGLIRVGGRLKNSDMAYEACHPILLPKHKFTELMIQREHIRNLHSGLQATIAVVRSRFWPLSVRSITRKVIREYIICFKHKPVIPQAIMGNLPENRVTVSRPFSHTGVDYAGPMFLKESKRRNAKLIKSYVALFVCFATKAVHIEVVSDLTSQAFLGAFKRFISRRGKPNCMYSDNGTAFVGAKRQMKEFSEFLNSDQMSNELINFLRDNETAWQFIPSHAPHFGGLWESAIKSTKTHLHRIVGNANLTFEELQTVLCEIEAMLNSRPLTPLSTDPNDLHCITPGHFLIGTALNSFLVPDLVDVPVNRLLRWERVEQLRQHFWKRWSSEYLHTLIER